MFLNISSWINISSFWTNIMLDCYRSCFDVLEINWMTIALAYFLEWTIFAFHWNCCTSTLAGWCCILSSQWNKHYIKYIIGQWYRQMTIIIYHHSYGAILHLSLPMMRSNIAHLYSCHKQVFVIDNHRSSLHLLQHFWMLLLINLRSSSWSSSFC